MEAIRPSGRTLVRGGYIIGPAADGVWFLALPFIAIGVALACQTWLTQTAVASIALLITVPHHCATWIRAYGIAEDRRRWRLRLTIGPFVILGLSLWALGTVPITFAFVGFLWDHQHSLMQQHGFARIYDFKGRTGAPTTGRYDLWLHWIVFGNLVITSPNFTPVWLGTLYQYHLPLTAETVTVIHRVSWTVTGAYLAIYAVHVARSMAAGYAINWTKYAFVFASYFLWYFCAWHAHSILIYAIAHRTMHGIQYIAISYVYTRKRTAGMTDGGGRVGRFLTAGRAWAFLGICATYAVLFQIIADGHLEHFFFGAFRFPDELARPLTALGLSDWNEQTAYGYFAVALTSVVAFTHFYFDSFIWRVRDPKTREGL